jgi:HlyD family secretion protein
MTKRLLVWIAALSLVAAAVVGVVWALRNPSEPEIRFETAPVERGRLTSHVTASGTLSALVTVQVGSQVSGRIEKLFADFNSVVKKGDVIAKIEPQLFQADVSKARANLVAASGNLARARSEADLAERQLARAKGLRAEGLSSQAELDTAEAAVTSAKAQIEALKGALEQARAAVQQAEINLAYTTIKSPIDGVVISRSVDVGQTVAASLSAPTLFTIAEDLRKMQVDTFVAEADVGKLQAGMTARFTVDAFPGRRFEGKVREIRNAPQTVQNVVTYDAVIDVENPKLELKPGMTANVSVVVAEKENVVKAPNAALRFRPGPELLPSASAGGPGQRRGRRGGDRDAQGSPPPPASSEPAAEVSAAAPNEADPPPGTREWRTVWVLREGRPEPVRVRVGITDGTNTEVVEGALEEGQQLIISASGGASPAGTSTPGGNRGRSFRMF